MIAAEGAGAFASGEVIAEAVETGNEAATDAS